MLNRKTQPDIKLIDKIDLTQPEKIILDNGVPVYFINSGQQDIFRIEIVFYAGTYFQDKVLSAKYASLLLSKGTQSLSAPEIANKLDYYGAQLFTNCNKDFSSITLYALNKYSDKLISLLENIVFEPTFPDNEFQLLNKIERQKFIVNNQQVKDIAREKFYKILFNEHPYGNTDEIEDFDKVSRESIESFYRRYYNTNNCFIIVTGKINKKLGTLTDKHLGTRVIHQVNGNASIKHTFTSYKPQHQLILKEDALQSAIRIGRPLFTKIHPDYISMKMLTTILGGYFGSRLMSNIREDKGYTYGIGSGLASMIHSGYFFIATEVGTDVRENALGEIYKEIAKLQEEKVPEKELELVRNYMIGHLTHSLDGPVGLADNFRNLVIHELDFNFINNFIEKIKNINANELQQMAVKYLGKEMLSEIVAGK